MTRAEKLNMVYILIIVLMLSWVIHLNWKIENEVDLKAQIMTLENERDTLTSQVSDYDQELEQVLCKLEAERAMKDSTIDTIIKKFLPLYPDLSLALIKGQIELESGFDNSMIGTSGEVGLMQILPSNLDMISDSIGKGRTINLYNVSDNIECGMWYLNQQVQKAKEYVGGDLKKSVLLGLSAYNCGPSRAFKCYYTKGKYFNYYQNIVISYSKKYQ